MRFLIDRQFHDRFQVDGDPDFFAHVVDADLHLPQRRLDRGGAVCIGDGRRAASHKAASAEEHATVSSRPSIGAADHDRDPALEKNIPLEGRPVAHRIALAKLHGPGAGHSTSYVTSKDTYP